MPILDDPSERPVCVPASKDEPFLPSIKSSVTSKPNTTDTNVTNSTNATSSIRNDNRIKDSYNSTNTSPQDNIYKATFKSYSSAPASESSTPFKLPTIDRSKSNSVSSLASERYGHKSRGRSRDRRARMCRSPSCPTSFWNEGPETPDTSRRLEEDEETTNSYVRPFLTHREDDGIKLPSIFQNRLSSNASLNTTSSTANSSTHNSRDTSPFSFRREATFLNLSNVSHSHEGSLNFVSPPRSREDGDNIMSRSGTQSSALLLPIQSGHDARNSTKAKRKRKKQNGLLNATDMGSDAEKLLREKLGAIERHDYDRSGSAHEGEKTNLSDTTFIDKVKDENSIANGAPEPLTSKPPIYQNTPARITTEKKVASVKA